jgi:hypothetical protein
MYQVPPPEPDPKYRYVVTEDPEEIAAIIRMGWGDPDGEFYEPTKQWVATAHSLQEFRRKRAEQPGGRDEHSHAFSDEANTA